ncbi:MAG: glycosyltransferase family 2 protein [Nitrosopumilaceae archaeon]
MKIVCIPAYNEEKNIGDIVKRSLAHVDKVIVCDDGSKDNTAKVARENGAEVISHKTNLGKGAAVKSLFKRAKELGAEVTVTIDGDGQFLPEEIPKLMSQIIEKKSDIVLGYRFGINSDIPSHRRFGNKVIAKMASTASNLPIRDAETGFRAYSKKAIELIEFDSNNFGMDAEILVNASKKGLKITEEDVRVIYNTGGRTSSKNTVSLFADMVTNLIELIAIHHPLKFLGLPGLGLMVMGLAFGIYVISLFNETRLFSIPSSVVAVGSFTIGLMLLLMSAVLFSISKTRKK